MMHVSRSFSTLPASSEKQRSASSIFAGESLYLVQQQDLSTSKQVADPGVNWVCDGVSPKHCEYG